LRRARSTLLLAIVIVADVLLALAAGYILLLQYDSTTYPVHLSTGSCDTLSVVYGSGKSALIPSLRYETVNVPRNSNFTVFANLAPGCTLLEWDYDGGGNRVITSEDSFIIDGLQGETTIFAIAADTNLTGP
jgi:hypothetical protein